MTDSQQISLWVGQLLDGNLAEADRVLLETALADAGSRQDYIDLVNLHASLKHATPLAALRETSIAPRPLGVVRRSFGWVRSVPGGEATVGVLSIAAVVAAFWGLSQFAFRPLQGPAEGGLRDQLAMEIASGVPANGESVASRNVNQPAIKAGTISNASGDARWLTETATADAQPTVAAKPAYPPLVVKLNERLKLAAGVAEIILRDGVRITLEGPAEIEPKANGKVFLHSGKLVALVPEKARGFIIQTEKATIVDLGTEFGVSTVADGTTRVAVFQGSVDLTAWDVKNPPVGPAPPAVRLVAGESFVVSNNTVVRSVDEFEEADEGEFLRVSTDRRVVLTGERKRCVSFGKPVQASSFYANGFKETFPAANVVDWRGDDRGTPGNWSFWLATEEDHSPTITVDLERSFLIGAIHLQNTHNRSHYDRGSRDYRLSVSRDGEAFTMVGEGVLPEAIKGEALGWVKIPIRPAVEGRFVRFEALSWFGKGAGLNELKVFAPPATSSEKQP